MIDFLEKYLLPVQVILSIICWTYMIKYVIIRLKEINLKK
jgi:hypothetical protein